MKYLLFISRHLSLSNENNKGTPAVKVAIVAVALSVAVMISSIAVVLGFRREITNRISGFNGHITFYCTDCENGLTYLSPSLRNVLEQQPYILNYEQEISVPTVIKTDNDFKGVYVKGFDGSKQYSFIKHHLQNGYMPDYSKIENDSLVVVSDKVANDLMLSVGDNIYLYFLNNQLKTRRFKISGIYDTHFDFYDDIFIFASPSILRSIVGVNPNYGTSIRILTPEIEKAPEYAKILDKVLKEGYLKGGLTTLYQVEDVSQQNSNYFSWLSLLDTNVIVILVLMSIVAMFTLIAALLILVIDKIKLIGILRAMGMPGRGIRTIFLLLSFKIALRGIFWGNIIILTLLYFQDKFKYIPLDAENYYINYIPVELSWLWIIGVNVVIFLLIILSLIFPSYSASHVSPVKAMQYNE